MSKQYSERLSPVAIVTAALLTYILAENLGGNGVLAVTTLGLFFGNIYIKEKKQLHEFSGMFANALEIFVFVLVGLMVAIPFTSEFFIRSFFLFIVYLFIRFIALSLTFPRAKQYTNKEKLFMTLNAPKGIAVAVIVFTLATKNIEGLKTMLDLSLAFVLYSIILSTIVTRFSKFFINVEVKTSK